MRIRNVKNKEEILNNSKIVIKNPEDYRGKWQEFFNNTNPIYIEIGMGKGKFILENAKKYPNINFIGLEKQDSIIAKSVKKLDEELPNLVIVRLDALNIDKVFSKEISRIYLNFSDPWPKKRHSKRRLASDSFLNLYNKISKNNINIKMKTDNKDLFAYSIMTYNNYGFKIKDISLDLPEDYENNVVTEYERKFRNQGITINYINVVKEVKYEE